MTVHTYKIVVTRVQSYETMLNQVRTFQLHHQVNNKHLVYIITRNFPAVGLSFQTSEVISIILLELTGTMCSLIPFMHTLELDKGVFL